MSNWVIFIQFFIAWFWHALLWLQFQTMRPNLILEMGKTWYQIFQCDIVGKSQIASHVRSSKVSSSRRHIPGPGRRVGLGRGRFCRGGGTGGAQRGHWVHGVPPQIFRWRSKTCSYKRSSNNICTPIFSDFPTPLPFVVGVVYSIKKFEFYNYLTYYYGFSSRDMFRFVQLQKSWLRVGFWFSSLIMFR